MNENNGLRITTGDDVTVWLSPEIVDFQRPIQVMVRNRRINRNAFIEPDIGVMLEDARSRADRQHPFWAKVSSAR